MSVVYYLKQNPQPAPTMPQSRKPEVLAWIDKLHTDAHVLTDLDAHLIPLTQRPAKATVLLFQDEGKFLEQIKTFTPSPKQLVIIFTDEIEEEGDFHGIYVRKMHPSNFFFWCNTPVEKPVEKVPTGFVGMIKRMLGLKKAA